MESGGGADDDEEDDDHTRNAAEKNVKPGLGIVTRTDLFFDEAGLEIKELPRGDGGAD